RRQRVAASRVNIVEIYFHPTAAALADFGAKRHIHGFAGAAGGDQPAGMLDDHIFERTAANGAVEGGRADQHEGALSPGAGAAHGGEFANDSVRRRGKKAGEVGAAGGHWNGPLWWPTH